MFEANTISDEYIINNLTNSNFWYGLYFTEPSLIEKYPKAGHAFHKEQKFYSSKYNNKLVHQATFYINYWSEEFFETNDLFEATPPFNFLESHRTIKDKKGMLLSETKISLNDDKLTSFVLNEKKKSKIVQNNVKYNLKDHMSAYHWTTSKNRKIGDKKTFIDLSEDDGIFEKEIHEILDIKEVGLNDSKEFYTRSIIEFYDELNGESFFTEQVINPMNICQEFGFPQSCLIAKLESKEKALEKIIQ